MEKINVIAPVFWLDSVWSMSFAQDTKGLSDEKYILLAFWLYFPEKFCLCYGSNGSSHKSPSMRAAGSTQLATGQYVCEASQIYDSKEEKMIVFIKLFSMLRRTDFTLYFLAPN